MYWASRWGKRSVGMFPYQDFTSRDLQHFFNFLRAKTKVPAFSSHTRKPGISAAVRATNDLGTLRKDVCNSFINLSIIEIHSRLDRMSHRRCGDVFGAELEIR